ncbi:MAG: BGTF surface domain-containing protein [Halanaeroarchaeum sp.]
MVGALGVGVGGVVAETATIDDGGTGVALEATGNQTITGTTSLSAGANVTVRVRSSGDAPLLQTRSVAVGENGTFSASFDLSGATPGTDLTVAVLHGSETLAETDGVVLPARSGFRDYVVSATAGETATLTVYLPERNRAVLVVGNGTDTDYQLRARLTDGNADGIVTVRIDTAAMGADADPVSAASDADEAAMTSQTTLESTVPAADYDVALMVGDTYDERLSVATLTVNEAATTTTTTTSTTTTTPGDSTTATTTPGFGGLVALVALVGAALVALRRET